MLRVDHSSGTTCTQQSGAEPPRKVTVMRFHALACDFDGTIAWNGQVDQSTVDALARVRQSDRKLILVTGRTLDDLIAHFPNLKLFDRVVAENGAVIHEPAGNRIRELK